MVVRVEPLGVDIDVRPGESIMAAAQRGGYYWPTQCHCQAHDGAQPVRGGHNGSVVL
jgi:hypothetical protein